jgi:hypothetical protein
MPSFERCVDRYCDSLCLAAELDQTGARSKVLAAHEVFVALNARFLVAITNWQIRPRGGDQLAANDHTDWSWDERVLDELHGLQGRLQPVCDGLVAGLARFAGYTERYSAALARVDRGERAWVAQPKIDSCHTGLDGTARGPARNSRPGAGVIAGPIALQGSTAAV